MVNIFGKGFIGSRFCEMSTLPCISNDRDDYRIKDNSSQILYFISTIHNYHVFDNPYLDIDTNLTTLIKVLESCKNKDVTFNFISSWFVYGDVELPATESSCCNPKGFYSITKRTAEQLLISYCETFNIKYRILRLANVVGKTDTKVSDKKNALQYMINRLKNNESLELYDGGNYYRDYIHVDDCAQAIELVITNGSINEIYNIGNGIPIYLSDAISLAKKSLGSTSTITSIPPRVFHTKVQTTNMVLNIDKLKSLGYSPKYNFEQITQDIISV